MFLISQSAEKYEIMFNQRQVEVLRISSAFDLPAQSIERKSIIYNVGHVDAEQCLLQGNRNMWHLYIIEKGLFC